MYITDVGYHILYSSKTIQERWKQPVIIKIVFYLRVHGHLERLEFYFDRGKLSNRRYHRAFRRRTAVALETRQTRRRPRQLGGGGSATDLNGPGVRSEL